ncbi:MAG: 3-hydroxyacyl-CoA dehydrogenase NAD-binding domain-containing protein [Armatimonadetes bacterium]|nr:3-hydroxyacyl-CoA dehydrogenase NAD-binding domain-containing protein [Armatimonadota bacterium]
MEKFAFIIHPLSAKRDVARKYPFVKAFPESWIEFGLRYKGPMDVSHITGVRSITGTEAEGWFVGCPLTPKLLLSLPIDEVWKKIMETVRIAEDHGAKIIGLGAFTSVVGDGGVTVAKNAKIAVTTGNSYTVATAIQGSIQAAELMGIDPAEAHVAVVGATGSIGKTCAQVFAKKSAAVTLIGRSMDRLEELARQISGKASVTSSTDVESGIKDADIVVTVSSAVDAIIEPRFIKSGAVVCDVARPRDVSVRVQHERDDVLVIEGGVVEIPGDVDFHFNFGFPPRTAYACMSETMMLALEGRYESFTLGKDVSVEQVEEISRIADKHGFKLAGFRSFEKAVGEQEIERIRKKAGRGNRE